MHNLPAYKALDVFWSIITLTRKIFITNDIKDSYFLFMSPYVPKYTIKHGGFEEVRSSSSLMTPYVPNYITPDVPGVNASDFVKLSDSHAVNSNLIGSTTILLYYLKSTLLSLHYFVKSLVHVKTNYQFHLALQVRLRVRTCRSKMPDTKQKNKEKATNHRQIALRSPVHWQIFF